MKIPSHSFSAFITKATSLTGLSISYMLLPCLIFFAGWLRPLIAFPAVIVLLLLGIHAIWYIPTPKNEQPLSAKLLAFVVISAGLYAFFSGIGGGAWQRADFIKHSLVLHDLYLLEWPIKYSDQTYLVYYLGWYMVPGILAKVTGAAWVELWTFLWSWMGMILVILWLVRLSGLKAWIILGFFFLFGGMDMLHILGLGTWEYFHDGALKYIRIAPIEAHLPAAWGLGHRIPAAFSQLAWVPQHAIGGWVASGLLLHSILHEKTIGSAGFYWVLTLLWSPFIALGWLPFLVFEVAKHKVLPTLSVANITSLLLPGGILMAYYLAHEPLDVSGFVWDTATVSEWPFLLMWFIFCEFGLLAGLIFRLDRAYRFLGELRPYFFLSIFTLLLMLFYRMGYYNDQVMRASIPAIWILCFCTARAIFSSIPRSSTLIALWVVLLVGTLAPLQEQAKSVIYTAIGTSDFRFETLPNSVHMPEVNQLYEEKGIPHPFDLESQYLGQKGAFFDEYLMRNED